MICLVQIPQRYMTVNGLSSFDAAVRLLSFGAFVPLSSTFAAALIGKYQIPPSFVILSGSMMQLVGAVLFSRIPSDLYVHPEQYGYQIMLGVGVGFVMCGLILLVPCVMEHRDLCKSQLCIDIPNPLTPISCRHGFDRSISSAGWPDRYCTWNCSVYPLSPREYLKSSSTFISASITGKDCQHSFVTV